MADRTVEVPCPRCAAAVAVAAPELKATPNLLLDCPTCRRPFPAAAAVLRQKARGIAPIGNTERPFERPEVVARFAEVWGEED